MVKNFYKLVKKKFILISVLFFFIFSLIGRFVYPVGDEPDFKNRSDKIIYQIDNYNTIIPKFTNPYLPFRWFVEKLLYENNGQNCKIISGELNFFSKIDYKTCSDNIKNILIRFGIQFSFFFPILLFISIKKNFFFLKKFGLSCSLQEWELRVKIFFLTILFPTVIFHLGFLSTESLSLLLSLVAFLFWGSTFLLSFCLFIILFIDIGTSILIIFYLFFIRTSLLFSKFFFKYIFFFLLFIIFIIFFRNEIFLNIIFHIPFFGTIAKDVFQTENELKLLEKYHLSLRPIITYLSLIFLTPVAKIKIIPAYLLFSFFMIKYFTNVYKKINFQQPNYHSQNKVYKNFFIFISSIFFVLTLVYLMPSYALAKYYIFLIPFALYSIISFFRKEELFLYLILFNILIFINLFLYYL
jgi:hypothetical protein